MKERPILFSTPMVKAILENRKNQTRRKIQFELNTLHTHYGLSPIAKENIKLLGDWYLSGINSLDNRKLNYSVQTDVDDNYTREINCPYGEIGDILWVRETWLKTENEYPNDCIKLGQYFYRADGETDLGKWKPSIFMPKEACRIRLKITDIRVERVQDISEKDAIAEGIVMNNSPHSGWYWMEDVYMTDSPTYAYECLWKKINGKESWDNNIWVWVIQFEKILKKN